MNKSEDGLNVAPLPTGDERKARSRAQYNSQRVSGSYETVNNNETNNTYGLSFEGRALKGCAMYRIVLTHDAPGTTQFKDYKEGAQTYANELKLP